ncbi:hypothetical protein [Saccharomonospora sp. CUA-673]|uniref:hypothetical protein n=1 Tax=Saccharomonospora sp. CUA-673 TaxID=1904969 RepID=UPI0021015C0B|nr:hypothetical protein [Saccharomonospora sp. CUA-673]
MTAEQASPAERHRWPAWVRLAIAFVLVAVVGVATVVILTGGPRTASPAARPLPLDTTPAQAGVAGDPGPGGNPDHRTLILYDEATAGDENAASAEAYAMFTANLASRAGAGTCVRRTPTARETSPGTRP